MQREVHTYKLHFWSEHYHGEQLSQTITQYHAYTAEQMLMFIEKTDFQNKIYKVFINNQLIEGFETVQQFKEWLGKQTVGKKNIQLCLF